MSLALLVKTCGHQSDEKKRKKETKHDDHRFRLCIVKEQLAQVLGVRLDKSVSHESVKLIGNC